ncbi:Arc family DNA-binding protein [Clostridium butyricum]|nr:Arc family DNA-binding protein [Clostridium butyricum]
MASQLPKFTLRVPQELLDKMKIIAQNNGRSVNKEIEMVLKEYIEKNSK